MEQYVFRLELEEPAMRMEWKFGAETEDDARSAAYELRENELRRHYTDRREAEAASRSMLLKRIAYP